jgi:hypothetical protein
MARFVRWPVFKFMPKAFEEKRTTMMEENLGQSKVGSSKEAPPLNQVEHLQQTRGSTDTYQVPNPIKLIY